MSQKKAGIIISYINTAITALMNIFLIPLFISNLGAAEYGVYKIINSFAGYLLIMDFGIGTIVTRYIAMYNGKNDNKQIDRCVATSVIVSIMLIIVVLAIGYVCKTQINNICGNSMTDEQLELAHDLYAMMLANIALSIFSHIFIGYINAFERFVFSNTLSTCRLVLRILIILVLLYTVKSARIIIATDLFLTIGLLLVYSVYCFTKINMRIDLRLFDKVLLPEYFMFSGAIFFQSVVNQINNSVDNMVLGVMASPEIVTMYSSGMTLYMLYVTLPQTIANVFLPQASRIFGQSMPNDDGTMLTRFVVRPGRYEVIICIAILAGFGLFGRDFISLWIGEQYIGAWKVAMLLMIPMTIPVCQNIMVSVLNARNKRMFRSLVLFGVATLNVGLTIIMVHYIGFIGAAISTDIAVFIGHGIIINIYYHKRFRLRIWYMCRELFRGILPCGIISFIISAPLCLWHKHSYVVLIIKVMIFMCIYLSFLYKFGINDDEKNVLIGFAKKIKGEI